MRTTLIPLVLGVAVSLPVLSQIEPHAKSSIVVFRADQPVRLSERPGEFWLQTNGIRRFFSNKVMYVEVSVLTNSGVRPRYVAQRVLDTAPSHSDQVAAEQRALMQRIDDARDGRRVEVARRETALRERATNLHVGMTAAAVIKLLGEPSEVMIRDQVAPHQFVHRPISPASFDPINGARSTLVYSPHKVYVRAKVANWPYESLSIALGEDGAVERFSWSF